MTETLYCLSHPFKLLSIHVLAFVASVDLEKTAQNVQSHLKLQCQFNESLHTLEGCTRTRCPACMTLTFDLDPT